MEKIGSLEQQVNELKKNKSFSSYKAVRKNYTSECRKREQAECELGVSESRVSELEKALHSLQLENERLDTEITGLYRDKMTRERSYKKQHDELEKLKTQHTNYRSRSGAIRKNYTEECRAREKVDGELRDSESRVIEQEKALRSLRLENDSLIQCIRENRSRPQSVLRSRLTSRFASRGVTPVKPIDEPVEDGEEVSVHITCFNIPDHIRESDDSNSDIS